MEEDIYDEQGHKIGAAFKPEQTTGKVTVQTDVPVKDEKPSLLRRIGAGIGSGVKSAASTIGTKITEYREKAPERRAARIATYKEKTKENQVKAEYFRSQQSLRASRPKPKPMPKMGSMGMMGDPFRMGKGSRAKMPDPFKFDPWKEQSKRMKKFGGF